MGAFETGSSQDTQAALGLFGSETSALMRLLKAADIEPGSAPSYQTCKDLYAYHPLGSKMADAPLNMAQSQERLLSIPNAPEEELLDAFWREWRKLGKVGADRLIHNTMKTSRIYGIGSIVMGSRGQDVKEPLDLWALPDAEIYFNVLDPLNTAGSLVLDQDPNSPDFQKPSYLQANGQTWHPSRSVIMLNEQPIYIQWTDSAFGFVGRSVYQRSLYPLKSYIQSMITDDVVTRKAALLVAKLKSPGSMIDAVARAFYAFKREAVNAARTGNVLGIGTDESVESLDLKNLRDAAEFARNNILKNIATGSNMPASMINQETLAEGFGEGSEDAKQIARYIDGVRIEMQPLYEFFDLIVMHRAWSPAFYESLQRKFPELQNTPYKTAFYGWKNSFAYEWPNLLVEPDSKGVERDAKIMESAIGVFEVIAPMADQANKARMAGWLADVMNARKMLVSTPLEIDVEAMAAYEPAPQAEPAREPETRAAWAI